MDIYELDTPALVVDLDIMERNLLRVGDYTRQHQSSAAATYQDT